MFPKLNQIVSFAEKFVRKKRRQKNDPNNILNHFHKTNSAFIHIPKAAGHSIRDALYGENVVGIGHTNVNTMRWLVGPLKWNSYFTFTFVRHPYDRLKSAFYYLKGGGKFPHDKEWADEHLSEFNNFEEFVLDWVSKENLGKKVVFYPQVPFIYDKLRRNKLGVDFIGKVETINRDFETVKNYINKKAKLKKKNVSKRKDHISNSVDEKLEKKIYDIYKEDYIKLGYKMKYG